MKKVLILALLLFGCETKNVTITQTEMIINSTRIHIYVIDDCEYIGSIYGSNRDFATHKGNCKYCTERNKLKK